MLESTILRNIRLALGTTPGLALWRNNTGVATFCQRWRECAAGLECPTCGTRMPRGDLQRVRYGLANGSADLIGVLDGRFLSLEVKAPRGRVSEEQQQWLECVRGCGGVADVVRSVEDAMGVVTRCR